MFGFLKNIFKSKQKPSQGTSESDPAAVYAVTTDTGRKNSKPNINEKTASSPGEEGSDNSSDDTYGVDGDVDLD
jgi:hypothetical protein